LVKKTCINCDVSERCYSSLPTAVTQEDCYNAVDGTTTITTEYKVDKSVCIDLSCNLLSIDYMINRVLTWMTSCVLGIPFIFLLFSHSLYIHVYMYTNVHVDKFGKPVYNDCTYILLFRIIVFFLFHLQNYIHMYLFCTICFF